jgi:hypothetical protein
MVRTVLLASMIVVALAPACGSEDDPAGAAGTSGTGGGTTGGTGGSGGKGGSGGTGGSSGSSGTGGGDDASAGQAGQGSGGSGASDGAALDIVQEFVDDPRCSGFCESLVAAGCEEGPKDAPECVVGCNQLSQGPCATQIGDVLDCAGPNPDVACDSASKMPVVTGCETESGVLNACLADAGP